MNVKGFVNLPVIIFVLIVVSSLVIINKSTLLNWNSNNSSSSGSINSSNTNKLANQSTYGFRFDTKQGGTFNVDYPINYQAAQDFNSKATTFKKINCQDFCDTLVVAIPGNISGDEIIMIGDKKYSLVRTGINPQNIKLYPKWTDKLGLIEINAYSNKLLEQGSDFYKIISSLKFIKDNPVPSSNPSGSSRYDLNSPFGSAEIKIKLPPLPSNCTSYQKCGLGPIGKVILELNANENVLNGGNSIIQVLNLSDLNDSQRVFTFSNLPSGKYKVRMMVESSFYTLGIIDIQSGQKSFTEVNTPERIHWSGPIGKEPSFPN